MTIWRYIAIPDDGGVHLLSADLSTAPATLSTEVWMVVTFSTDLAGWVLAVGVAFCLVFYLWRVQDVFG